MVEHGERTLRVIEPNLAGRSGHYAEFVRALAARSQHALSGIRVWGPSGAAAALHGISGVRVELPPVVGRAGEIRALREALASADPFLVLTARAEHAPTLEWLARGARGTGGGAMRDGLDNARLYFHWQERGVVQRALMALAPSVKRRAVCIAPTRATADFLRGAGWQRVACVPYPALAPQTPPSARPFSHLLVAGAARVNKGIECIAALAEEMAARGDATPLHVQTTAKRVSGRRGDREARAIERLRASGARGILLSDHAPDRAEYAGRFAGALVLAPYDRAHFADNVSGVVLDALLHGAPVIATAGTWPGAMVERFGAGALLQEATGAALADAVERVRRDWELVSGRARHAAGVLAAEHDPAALNRVLRDGV